MIFGLSNNEKWKKHSNSNFEIVSIERLHTQIKISGFLAGFTYHFLNLHLAYKKNIKQKQNIIKKFGTEKVSK